MSYLVRERKSCSEPLALSWKNESPNQVWDRDQIPGKKMSRMLELSQAKTYGTYHDQTAAGKNLKKDIDKHTTICYNISAVKINLLLWLSW